MIVTQTSRRQQFVTTVLANESLCRDHYRLTLGLPQFPPTQPGHFIQISCRDLDQDYSPEQEMDWRDDRPLDARSAPSTSSGQASSGQACGIELMSPLAMLRRPFSLAGRRDTASGVELDIIHRIVGVGTDWLAKLTTDDLVHILGPLGNTFTLPKPGGLALLVGGGVGIPPMLYLADALNRAERRGVAFSGALTRDLLPLTITDNAPAPTADSTDPLYNIAEFARNGIPAVITTDDGSYGFRGYVTQALERYLEGLGFTAEGSGVRGQGSEGQRRASSSLTPDSRLLTSPPIIYTCGPEPMMRRVADIAAARNIECQVAVERAMACGMGTCQSCCIKVRKPDPAKPPLPGRDWCYRLACTDGPVFRGSELLW
jgi:dihydroorotate dehydrogenase electron transfer subunit